MTKILIATTCFVFASLAFASGNSLRDDAAVSQEEVDQHLSDMDKALNEARAIPHFENGKPAGYRKVSKKSARNYQMLELKNSEVITAPNPEDVPSSDAPEAPRYEDQR